MTYSIRTRPSGVGAHLLEAALAVGQRGLDWADELGRDVDGDPLVRLVDVAVDVAQQDLRARDLAVRNPRGASAR